ncbi:MAG: hypothetical protein HZB16_17820 [Armatimonadetes bacterium]|nr:hypothetical protein [Armatimonadota bacterium]
MNVWQWLRRYAPPSPTVRRHDALAIAEAEFDRIGWGSYGEISVSLSGRKWQIDRRAPCALGPVAVVVIDAEGPRAEVWVDAFNGDLLGSRVRDYP